MVDTVAHGFSASVERLSLVSLMPARQRRDFVQARGWSAVEYVDCISGTKDRRPELDRLVTDAKAARSIRSSSGNSIASVAVSSTW